ncbi:MAG: hypothetical protein K2F87_02145 [Muribaculaceae bacterium]|nr:hypothetical protein [Muribaculaceae bacterium]
MENIDLLGKARQDLIADMKARGIGAILWDNATAGFQYIPEINLAEDETEQPDTSRIMGLYRYDDELYLVEEDKADVDFNDFYDADTEVKPSVVTLTEDIACKELGNPTEEKGYTTEGSLEEWLAIADCYFEALNEAREEEPE